MPQVSRLSRCHRRSAREFLREVSKESASALFAAVKLVGIYSIEARLSAVLGRDVTASAVARRRLSLCCFHYFARRIDRRDAEGDGRARVITRPVFEIRHTLKIIGHRY